MSNDKDLKNFLETFYDEMKPLMAANVNQSIDEFVNRKIKGKNVQINARSLNIVLKLMKYARSKADFVEMMLDQEVPPIKLTADEMQLLKGGSGSLAQKLFK